MEYEIVEYASTNVREYIIKKRNLTSNYTDDQITEAAKRAFIDNPLLLKIGKPDCPKDVNGRVLDMEILCNLTGLRGAQWRQVRHFIAVNFPGLIEESPSPDNNLRRGREVRESMRKNNQVRPALSMTQ
jgi:hypothetical protein